MISMEIAREYFSRVRNRDFRVFELFHDDAILRGLGPQISGRAEIEAFYRKVIERGGPSPRVASVLGDEERVAVEIFIDFPSGAKIHAIDLFEIQEHFLELFPFLALRCQWSPLKKFRVTN